jgi:hypothetical protein
LLPRLRLNRTGNPESYPFMCRVVLSRIILLYDIAIRHKCCNSGSTIRHGHETTSYGEFHQSGDSFACYGGARSKEISANRGVQNHSYLGLRKSKIKCTSTLYASLNSPGPRVSFVRLMRMVEANMQFCDPADNIKRPELFLHYCLYVHI